MSLSRVSRCRKFTGWRFRSTTALSFRDTHDLSLTPGRSSGEPMNSIPALSRALSKEFNVFMLAEGNPVPASMRLIVASPIWDIAAKSRTVILKIDLAALICSLVINLFSLYNDPYSINIWS